MGLTRIIAIGSSISVGLGLFILIDLFLQQAGQHTPQTYLLALLCFIPLIFSYAERAAVTPGTGGIFALVRAGGLNWQSYASGWLLLGGHLALIALLGWGAALYLHSGMERLIGQFIDMRWLAPGMVLLVLLNDLIGTQGGWRLRTTVMYGGIIFLIVFAAWSFWWMPFDIAVSTIQSGTTFDLKSLLPPIAFMGAMLWSINFALDSRDEMRQPEQIMLPSLLIPLLLSGLIGATLSILALPDTQAALSDIPALIWIARTAGRSGSTFFEIGVVTTGLLICLTALDRAMVTTLRLVGTMVRDGFIPERFVTISPGFGTPLIALRILALGSVLAAAFVPAAMLVGLVALAFLSTTALLNMLSIRQLTGRLPVQRQLKLPLHPLFPALSLLISGLLALLLPLPVLLIGIGWGLVGALYYKGFARAGGMAVRRREVMVGTMTPVRERSAYTVLVCVANPDTAPALMRAGALLARSRQGRMLVLEIAVFPDQVPQYLQRQLAGEQLRGLNDVIQGCKTEDVPVEVLVRLAQSPVEGILGTAQEEKVDLLLLGWEGRHVHDQFDPGMLVDPVVRLAQCDVVVLRGSLPLQPRRILVPATDSPNSLAAMHMALNLVNNADGKVVALNLVQEVYVPATLDMASKRLREMMNGLDRQPNFELRILPTDDVTGDIVREAEKYDMLLLGASRGGVLDQAIFGGLPVEVARSSLRPLLLVKHYEGARRFWIRRAWEMVYGLFPSLSVYERTEANLHLRQAAHPSIDFFIMISLSAMIATLGLLQGSPAVIIGAMLVAPLMSPILAMGISIVQGNLWLLRLSMRSMLSGVALAVGIGIIMTMVATAPVNTAEILARTRPNLLDLLVALASGAAGAYAIARKEVAAALPGVAIAAALVPPLGVVGYGIATGQLEIAGGALLLFITNLVAIVVAAAIVFLLLGFRPPRARLREQVRIKFLVSLLALVGVTIPLAIFSLNTTDQIRRQNQVETVLSQEFTSESLKVTDVLVERRNGTFEIHATIYTLDGFNRDQLDALETRLSEAVQTPVKLYATVLQAVLLPEE